MGKCGPSKRWVTGEVEFWCEKHAYAKTMYPTDTLDAEEVAVKRGWRQLKNGSWQCPWCVGAKNKYLKKFHDDFFYPSGVYFKPHAAWKLVMTPELEAAMHRLFLKKKEGVVPEKLHVRRRKSA